MRKLRASNGRAHLRIQRPIERASVRCVAVGSPEPTEGEGEYRMRKFIIMVVSAALGVFGLVAGAGSALAASSGTVITVANTPFGKALVVGSGPYKGFSLYDITSDHPPSYGCTTTPVSLPGLPPNFLCTGPSNDHNAEWPAITTTGAPI